MATEKENLEGFVRRLLGATRHNHENYAGSLDHRFDIKRDGLTAQDLDLIVRDVETYRAMPELHKHKFATATLDMAQFKQNITAAIDILNNNRQHLPGADVPPLSGEKLEAAAQTPTTKPPTPVASAPYQASKESILARIDEASAYINDAMGRPETTRQGIFIEHNSKNEGALIGNRKRPQKVAAQQKRDKSKKGLVAGLKEAGQHIHDLARVHVAKEIGKRGVGGTKTHAAKDFQATRQGDAPDKNNESIRAGFRELGVWSTLKLARNVLADVKSASRVAHQPTRATQFASTRQSPPSWSGPK